jgi:penicillin-binding protein 2
LAKRDPRDENRGREKVQWLSIIVIALFAVLLGRLFYLQKVKYSYYAQYAEENQLQRERIVAPRGLILDRGGNPLVENIPSFDVVLPWQHRSQVKPIVRDLGYFLPIDSFEVFERLETWEKKHGGAPFPIIQDANKIEISFVRENYDRFPRLRVETRSSRHYRLGLFASHLLGYVGEVNDDFLAENESRGYFAGDVVGKAGVEGICEEYLKGKDGQSVVAVNASGTVLGDLPHLSEPPIPGKNVFLTIDAKAQLAMEGLISKHRAGAAIVMDVHDGSILAAVSLPQFDPNHFVRGIDRAEWDALSAAEDKPLFNRFVTAAYPPGSTLKVVSAFSILTNHVVNPDAILVFCNGSHRFGNRVFKCWKPEGHGSMDLYNGFVNSCDSYFFEVGEVMNVNVFAEAAREFGLGARTGIEFPNEAAGNVPDKDYYDRNRGKGKWTQGLMLNNIIGQGEYLATVLQMCRAAAVVANGGYLVQPHVVKEIEGVTPAAYTKIKVDRMTPATLAFLRRAMTGVVHDPRGTGRGSRVPGMLAAGKTGTAQNPHGEDHAWFIGFAPADNPEVSLAIVVENAGHGGAIAAPIARDFYLEYFKETPPESLVTRTGAEDGGNLQTD